MKIRDIIRLIEAEGWYLVETRGSHRQVLLSLPAAHAREGLAGRVLAAGKGGGEDAGRVGAVTRSTALSPAFEGGKGSAAQGEP